MKTLIALLLSLLSIKGFTQNTPPASDIRKPFNETKLFLLKDPDSENSYMVDSEKVNVYLINHQGEILWKKDPFEGVEMAAYFKKKPFITNFYFSLNEPKNIIIIRYNNGITFSLDIKTGKIELNGHIFGVRRAPNHKKEVQTGNQIKQNQQPLPHSSHD